MSTLNLAEFEDCVVIHFGMEGPRINAYTLASTLTSIADAAKAANSTVNPGYDVEILVESLGSGSFKAKIRSVYRGADNLFSKQNLKAIVLGIIASFIYQHTLAPDTEVVVNVGPSEVVIEQGDKTIIIPREVHDATKEAEKSPEFRSGVARTMRALDADERIRSVGLLPEDDDDDEREPEFEIPRDRFALLPNMLDEEGDDSRDLFEVTNVEILRAILERSRRKWEFVWGGNRISAPVLDQGFYDDFFAHKITIAPGDRLTVRLRVRQKRLPDIGVWMNDKNGYEVLEVMKHIPQPKQRTFQIGK